MSQIKFLLCSVRASMKFSIFKNWTSPFFFTPTTAVHMKEIYITPLTSAAKGINANRQPKPKTAAMSIKRFYQLFTIIWETLYIYKNTIITSRNLKILNSAFFLKFEQLP